MRQAAAPTLPIDAGHGGTSATAKAVARTQRLFSRYRLLSCARREALELRRDLNLTETAKAPRRDHTSVAPLGPKPPASAVSPRWASLARASPSAARRCTHQAGGTATDHHHVNWIVHRPGR